MWDEGDIFWPWSYGWPSPGASLPPSCKLPTQLLYITHIVAISYSFPDHSYLIPVLVHQHYLSLTALTVFSHTPQLTSYLFHVFIYLFPLAIVLTWLPNLLKTNTSFNIGFIVSKISNTILNDYQTKIQLNRYFKQHCLTIVLWFYFKSIFASE